MPATLLDLVAKYNRPGPRYTSYPTAPQFTDAFDADAYVQALRTAPEGDLSLYVHLPFCRSLCHYCACHMRVTQQLDTIARYLDHLMREIDLVAEHLAPGQRIVQMHWGGGTPTYLSPSQIEALVGHLRRRFAFAPGAEISLEADPRGLTREHLTAARNAGFNRVSFGVQDFDAETQRAIGRVQPRMLVTQATRWARELKFEGVSYDLIYGLPHQTVARFRKTVDAVLDLAPDRVSLFSYAHVPWKKRHQTLIDAATLPTPPEKLRILLDATGRLQAGGYVFLGMDHFARPDDPLCQAQIAGTMQRNFQGYSTHAGSTLVGLGVSAIGQFPDAYAQNTLRLSDYYSALDAGRLPTARGYALTTDDRLRRHVIMTLMCRLTLSVPAVEQRFGIDFRATFPDALEALRELEADGLVTCTPDRITVTERGRLFLRNVAMPFDAYVQPLSAEQPRYSQTV